MTAKTFLKGKVFHLLTAIFTVILLVCACTDKKEKVYRVGILLGFPPFSKAVRATGTAPWP